MVNLSAFHSLKMYSCHSLHPCYDLLQIVCDQWYNYYDIGKLTSTLVLCCFSFNLSVSNRGTVSDIDKLVSNRWLGIIWLLQWLEHRHSRTLRG